MKNPRSNLGQSKLSQDFMNFRLTLCAMTAHRDCGWMIRPAAASTGPYITLCSQPHAVQLWDAANSQCLCVLLQSANELRASCSTCPHKGISLSAPRGDRSCPLSPFNIDRPAAVASCVQLHTVPSVGRAPAQAPALSARNAAINPSRVQARAAQAARATAAPGLM